ncbi:MAG TPA: hypothetical protein VGP72_18525 [Planctomycetota bacterium]|jgi:hypothetical protein
MLFHLTKLQTIFVASVFGVFIVSAIASLLVRRAASRLDFSTLERIARREDQGVAWWRAPDILGITLMLGGMLIILGILKAPAAWGLPSMVIGLFSLCLATSWRAWLSRRAFSAEAPGSPASRSALWAAVIVTLSEAALGGFVCWNVFPIKAAAKRTATSATKPAEKESPQPEKSLWVDEAEALRLLPGKNAAYLKALAQRQDVRTQSAAGRTLYHSDDIEKTKQAGLPSWDEIKATQKQ